MAGGSLIDREFIGTILPAKDSVHQGKYKVNVPELQPHMKDSTGIWCKNHTCKNRITPSADGIYGSYYPLHPGISVIVKFFANHIESGYIDRIISDAYSETLPYEIIERDDYYQILRTPKHNNLIAIYEGDSDSKNVPKNSIHIYYNETRTTVVIDETGINVKTDDNINVTVAKNVKVTIVGTADVHVTGATQIKCDATADIHVVGATKVKCDDIADIHVIGATKVKCDNTADIHVVGATKLKCDATLDVKSAGNMNLTTDADMNLKATGIMNLQAATINSNGTATAAAEAVDAADAADAVDADLPILITRTDYEYFTRSTGI